VDRLLHERREIAKLVHSLELGIDIVEQWESLLGTRNNRGYCGRLFWECNCSVLQLRIGVLKQLLGLPPMLTVSRREAAGERRWRRWRLHRSRVELHDVFWVGIGDVAALGSTRRCGVIRFGSHGRPRRLGELHRVGVHLRRGLVSFRKSYVKLDFRCGPPELSVNLPMLKRSWSSLRKPAYRAQGLGQCTLRCPVGYYLYPKDAPGLAATDPAYSASLSLGHGFASMLTTADLVLISSVRLDGRQIEKVASCALHVSNSEDCQRLYRIQKRWARAVLSTGARPPAPVPSP